MTDPKPRRVKAKITCTVVMTAEVLLNRDGGVEDVIESDEIFDYSDINLDRVITARSYFD